MKITLETSRTVAERGVGERAGTDAAADERQRQGAERAHGGSLRRREDAGIDPAHGHGEQQQHLPHSAERGERARHHGTRRVAELRNAGIRRRHGGGVREQAPGLHDRHVAYSPVSSSAGTSAAANSAATDCCATIA